MQKVKFLQGFQGKETREVWYEKGDIAEFGDDLAQDLAGRKVVEILDALQVVVEDTKAAIAKKRAPRARK